MGDANPVGHHVTNIVITRIDDRSARVQSKGIGIKADGTAGSVALRRHRHAPARRLEDQLPQGDGQASGTRRARSWARAVLQRLRQAAISQSADEMGRLYAVDAVHEFPFTPRCAVPAERPGRNRELDNRRLAGLPAEVRALPDPCHLRHQRSGNDHRRAGSCRDQRIHRRVRAARASLCSPCATGRSPICATTSTSRPPRLPWDAICETCHRTQVRVTPHPARRLCTGGRLAEPEGVIGWFPRCGDGQRSAGSAGVVPGLAAPLGRGLAADDIERHQVGVARVLADLDVLRPAGGGQQLACGTEVSGSGPGPAPEVDALADGWLLVSRMQGSLP